MGDSTRSAVGGTVGFVIGSMFTAHGSDHVAAALLATPAGGGASFHHVIGVGRVARRGAISASLGAGTARLDQERAMAGNQDGRQVTERRAVGDDLGHLRMVSLA